MMCDDETPNMSHLNLCLVCYKAETVIHAGVQLAQAGECCNAVLQHTPANHKCISHNNL